MNAASTIVPAGFPSERAMEGAYAASRDRKLRDRLFEHRRGLFSDPAWDMLVDLFVAQIEGKRLSTSSVCLAAGVPMTTALRHLDLLVKQGLVGRVVDPTDRRRSFNQLTVVGLREMTRYFENAAR